MWLNRFYFQISNSNQKKCLTIDTREVNELGPGKFRIFANNGEEQTCYFNRNKSDTHFSSFIAKRIRKLPNWTIRFSIVKVKSDFELVNKSLDIELKNSSLVSDGRSKTQLQQTGRGDLGNGKTENKQTTDITIQKQRRRNDTKHRDDDNGGKLDRTVRKKPRFLS